MQRARAMLSKESMLARLGLVALALVAFKSAMRLVWAGLLPLHPFAIGLLITLSISGFALLVVASSRWPPGSLASRSPREALILALPMLLVIAAYAYEDAIRRATWATYPTTDAHAYTDVAARILLQGKNPYAHSLADAYRVFQVPMRFSTPLVDGDFSDRMAYPSLSFLVLVPLVALHLPTYVAYAACFLAIVALLVARAPWWARGLLFSLLVADETFLRLAFGGVTDTVWTLCLVGAIFAWHRPRVAALLVGLACAQKQHAWFFVPYLVVRVCRENDAMPWHRAPRAFVLAIASVFVAANLPFVLWGPTTWAKGLLEPLVAPMIQLSEGLTVLGMTGYVTVPRPVTSAIFWLLFAFSVFAYARHTSALREACWVLPAVVLWFGYRALLSYWYFNALFVIAALVARRMQVPPVLDRRPAWTLRLGVGVAIGVAAALMVCAIRASPYDVEALGPFETWDAHVYRLRVRVANRSSSSLWPRFHVQTDGLQPVQWAIEAGEPVAPGDVGTFMIRAPRPSDVFELTSGARVAVSDRDHPDRRAFTSIAPEPPVRVDVAPNERFRFVDTRTRAPFGWSIDKSDPTVAIDAVAQAGRDEGGGERARVRMRFEAAAPASAVTPATVESAAAANAAASGDAASIGAVANKGAALDPACFVGPRLERPRANRARFGALHTIVELPEGTMRLDIQVPEGANAPPWSQLYGLHLATFGWQGFVLFGATEERGTLPTGEPFVAVAAPHGEWSTVSLHVRALLEALGAPLEVRRFTYPRLPALDVPSLPIQIGLFASAPPDASATIAFGAIASTREVAREDAVVARGLVDAAGRDTWRAARELEMGNAAHAVDLVRGAVASSPTSYRLTLLGDAALRSGQFDLAHDSYVMALARSPSPEAEKGIGWALVGLGATEEAAVHFERARKIFADEAAVRPRAAYVDSLRGLVVACAKSGACGAATNWLREAKEEDPRFVPPLSGDCLF